MIEPVTEDKFHLPGPKIMESVVENISLIILPNV